MTKMKKAIVKSACEKFIGLIIVAIAITISVNTIASVNAFSLVPSQLYASRKSFANRNGRAEYYKSINRLYQSNLFAHERLHDSAAERFESSTKKAKRTTNGDFQKALAGLVLALTIATGTVGGFPLPANAGFGPSSAATTTPPPNLNSIKTSAAKVAPEKAPTTDFDIDLDGKKLKILIDSSLNVRRLEEFSGQLDDLIDTLKDSISSLDLTFGGDDDDDEQKEELRKTGDLRQEELRKAENIRLQVEEQEKRLQKLERQPYWFNYFAAFVGATVSTVAMHPVDTIKIRMQVGIDDDDDDDKGCGTGAETGGAPLKTKQVSIASAIGSGSIGSLYQGLIGNLFKEVPSQAIYLGVYESVKLALSPKVAPEYLLWVYLVAGAAGETVGSVLRAPAEAVKSLVQSKAQANAWEAAKSVLGTPNGRQNVVRAWSASIGRDVPFGGIQLAIFEAIKAGILNDPNLEIDSSTLLSEAFIGAFAGGVGAFVTNPTDVIITRIITQDTTTTVSGEEYEEDLETTAPLGVLEMGQKIYQEEGVGAFFVGWVPRVGYWAPAIGMFLSCYCSVRRAGITYDWFP